MAHRRKGRWEDGEFLPMLSATELARPYRPADGDAGAGPEHEAARQRGLVEHERFDRAARRHLGRRLWWGSD